MLKKIVMAMVIGVLAVAGVVVSSEHHSHGVVACHDLPNQPC